MLFRSVAQWGALVGCLLLSVVVFFTSLQGQQLIGFGRDAAVRSLSTLGIQVEKIVDLTGVPHGGVRPRKARRV